MPTVITSTKKMPDTHQILDHHLKSFAQGLDALVSDYCDQSVVQLPDRTVRGLSEIRQFFSNFLESIKPGFWEAFQIQRQVIEGDIAYLVWNAKPFVVLATDTLYVREGKILIQTFTSFSQ
ncbi:nuclear transport factor 2 family protein [Variovorax sp. J22G21]|uniref:nuclear transport factor 2 family protein n=1 Tax=Variovorax fucosicus TaxID=3053517 RepID=UPI002578A62B|nr:MULTISPECIES: nuclear transport factor 2 family protein [unclassified Variovorax]MDM0037407.1 nuclear transport factor 2 family protein [Variovorax sp. J22R193]MDM0062183.1 nuclear transport factor 2 family protein [Variovorax sp. J22G21]